MTSTEPLVAMSNRADLNTIRDYLDRGFNVNTVDRYNHNLIYYAIQHNEPKIIELAIDRGADISDNNNLNDEDRKATEKTDYYNNNVRNLSESKRMELLNEIRSGSPYQMNNILRYAVTWNQVKIAKHLLANGIRSSEPLYNTTLLHIATLYQDGEIVKALLDSGMNPNISDRNRCTPLHTAILRHKIVNVTGIPSLVTAKNSDDSISEQAIRHLLNEGAHTNIRCFFGSSYSRSNFITPIDAARIVNRPDLVNLMRQAGGE
jgi:ankyrin repeat protein